MSSGPKRSGAIDSQLSGFTRQATILRKNLMEWDHKIRTPGGEDWPTMLGRLNAAMNQTANMDRAIDDVLEHFVYQPRQSTANAQDIPFFLSTRLETATGEELKAEQQQDEENSKGDPVQQLARFETSAARLAAEYEENMVRF